MAFACCKRWAGSGALAWAVTEPVGVWVVWGWWVGWWERCRLRAHLNPLPLSGITEPIATGVDAGLRLGVGKAEQDAFYVAAENVTRRKLESEVQAAEDADAAARREQKVERDRRIQDDVSNALKPLYCEVGIYWAW